MGRNTFAFTRKSCSECIEEKISSAALTFRCVFDQVLGSHNAQSDAMAPPPPTAQGRPAKCLDFIHAQTRRTEPFEGNVGIRILVDYSIMDNDPYACDSAGKVYVYLV